MYMKVMSMMIPPKAIPILLKYTPAIWMMLFVAYRAALIAKSVTMTASTLIHCPIPSAMDLI